MKDKEFKKKYYSNYNLTRKELKYRKKVNILTRLVKK